MNKPNAHLCSFTISLNKGLPFNTVAPVTFIVFATLPCPIGGKFSFATAIFLGDFLGDFLRDLLGDAGLTASDGTSYTHPRPSTSLTNSSNGLVSRIVLLLPNTTSLLFARVNATFTRLQS